MKIIIHKLDLCSFESVRKFAELINNTETHIDVLIHNAGIGGGFYKFYETKDNLDVIMQTNYLGNICNLKKKYLKNKNCHHSSISVNTLVN